MLSIFSLVISIILVCVPIAIVFYFVIKFEYKQYKELQDKQYWRLFRGINTLICTLLIYVVLVGWIFFKQNRYELFDSIISEIVIFFLLNKIIKDCK